MVEIKNPLQNDPRFDGSCPCSKFTKDRVSIETHCWRSNCVVEHEFSCVHYWPNTVEALKLAEETADYIRYAYHTDTIVYLGDLNDHRSPEESK